MILTVGGQKGGSGKSNTAVNLTVQAMKAGLKTILVDLDPQGTSSDWASIRNASNHDHIVCLHKRGAGLAKDLAALNKDYELVVVDCDGHSSENQIAAMTVSNIFLIILRTTAPEMWTLGTMQKIHDAVAPINPALRTMVVFNQVTTNPLENDFACAIEIVKEQYPDFEAYPHPIKIRKGFPTAFATGRGVSELEGSSSSNESGVIEINRLFKYLMKG